MAEEEEEVVEGEILEAIETPDGVYYRVRLDTGEIITIAEEDILT